MSKIRLLAPLLGLLAAATIQGCGNSSAVNNGGGSGSGGSGGSGSAGGNSGSVGGSSGSAGAGGSPNATSHKVTILGSGS